MRSIRLPAGTHPGLAKLMRDVQEMLSPSDLVRDKVRERQAGRRERSERVDSLLARATALLAAAEPLRDRDPADAMRLIDAAAACNLMAEEINADGAAS